MPPKPEHRSAASYRDLLAGLLAVEVGMADRLLRELGVNPLALRDQLQACAVS